VLREQQAGQILRTEDELYRAFLRAPDALDPDDILQPQFETALGHLEAQGVVQRLGFGNLVLLQPERLDAYASALLIAVKNEPDGLGSIAEQCVQKGQFSIPREERLHDPSQEQWLLIAMIEELVRQELALREGGFLLFPSQSTREHPEYAALSGKQMVTFTFAGPVLSIYTRLVVRLAQSDFFQKRDIWRHVVTYTNRRGGTYGLLLTPRGEERAELGLFFDEAAREEMRFHFEDFVYKHLERHAGGTVQRLRRFVCSTCGFVVPEQLVQLLSQQGTSQFDCIVCHTNILLLDGEERQAPLSTTQIITTERMEQAADERRDRQSAAALLPGKVATQDFDVFLCHNGQDKPAVRKICEQIKELGLLPWLDEEQLQPGLPWQPLLEKQIMQIKSAAVFVGKSGLGPWQQREIDALLREFKQRGCPVIPVLLLDAPHKRKKPSLPVFLRGMTWVDFRVQKPDPLQRLYWGITGKREKT